MYMLGLFLLVAVGILLAFDAKQKKREQESTQQIF